MSISTSYVYAPSNPSNDEYGEIDSISDTMSNSSSSSSSSSQFPISDAEREWQESLQQLELLLTMVLVPYLGKYFGRKCAYLGWAKFMSWKYPVKVEVTSRASFKGAGAAETAASL